MPVERERFQRDTDCLLCCLNYCIGLSNVATFPYLIYDNGGVVFIVVYLVLMCIVAVPMLYLEIFLGQFSGWSVPRAFAGFPMAKGLGWTMILSVVLVIVFYISPVAYSVIYMAALFQTELPWNSCSGGGAEERDCYHFKPGMYACSKVNETLARRYGSHNYSGEGAIVVSSNATQEPVSVPMREYEALRNNCVNGTVSAAGAFYTRRVARSDFQSEGFTDSSVGTLMAMTIAWALVFVVVCMGVRSLKKTWVSASQHMFYSVGLAMGAITFFASHNQFDWPILGTAVRIATADFLFGLFGGCVVFSIYGHLNDMFPVEIIDVASSGLNYAFVTFPECAQYLPWSRLWLSAFYIMTAVGNLGATGLVSGFRSSVSSAMYTDIIPWIGVAEAVTVAYAYGVDRFVNDVYFTFNERPPVFLQFCWRFVCPTTLMVMSLVSMLARASSFHSTSPGSDWTNPVVMFVFVSVVVLVGAFVLHALAENKYDLYAAMEPQPGYGPKDPDQHARYIAFLAERNAVPSGLHLMSSKVSSTRPSTALETTTEGNLRAHHADTDESALTLDERRSLDVIAKLERANAMADAYTLPTTTAPSVATLDTTRATATTTAAEPSTATTLSDGKETSTSTTASGRVDKASR
ncbi:hypothetical protein HPB50_019208 [Hyalomma asiaticum]|uniref:Uncharacterized protein n=1 Tax=Hyalomma asiaticum TaxID=266040 RepID=A0ACB7SX41_HYAAI|nr:hypothetical protein HPB50_019208 [Hyalomma asiaticum]